MLFNSFEYLVFLPVVVFTYWLVPRQAKTILLIAASYFFYMYSFKVYGLLLLALTAGNFVLGNVIHQCADHTAKRLLLVAGIALNLSTLAIFKYTNFILDSLNFALAWMHFHLRLPVATTTGIYDLPIILPLAISFFVFEFIHYLVDIFKGSEPVRSPIRFALFASFFPSQIAGPIKRYQDFNKQLEENPKVTFPQFSTGLFLIAQGLFKKIALGDNLAPVVKAGFDNPHLMGTLDGWICIIAFAFQIYYDFSGYTDIGRGSANLLGFSLPENFNMPYIAGSLKDFWHRWHMSLSTWLKDYLFIPLGGSKGSESATAANLLTTMLLGGLWHGASWTFVLWGIFHGVGLGINRFYDKQAEKSAALKAFSTSLPAKAAGYAITFVAVLCGWVLFRAKTLPEAMAVYQSMFTLRASSVDCSVNYAFFNSSIPAAIAIYLILLLSSLLIKKLEERQSSGSGVVAVYPPPKSSGLPLPGMAHLGISFFIAIVMLAFCRGEVQPFIYFQF